LKPNKINKNKKIEEVIKENKEKIEQKKKLDHSLVFTRKIDE
jgi:hypothetical protein